MHTKDKHRKYGRAWKRIRDREAKEHPYCVTCLQKGIKSPTEEIHHIVPISQGGKHTRDNLIALCKECHAKVHKRKEM